jgi:hypothetical protein
MNMQEIKQLIVDVRRESPVERIETLPMGTIFVATLLNAESTTAGAIHCRTRRLFDEDFTLLKVVGQLKIIGL